ncbi:mucin-2-like [Daphnia carinata]|uniref:mucin-2-like n=1 Tax=Daphnia carinata TaxID=120202 RepID=UPI002868BDA5|nr:mucin-2-like [Daphnia carinata]
MTIMVAGQNEWEEFNLEHDESLLYDDISSYASTPPVATANKVNNNSIVFPTSPSKEPDPEPEPKSPTAAIHALNAKTARPYSFGYAVEDSKAGLDFGHSETSDGTSVTGTYYVLLPDGRKETVNYKADANGYVAEVSYEGEAKFDDKQALKTKGTFGKLQVDSGNSGPGPAVGTNVETPRSGPSSKAPSSQVVQQTPTALGGSTSSTLKTPTVNISSTASTATSALPSSTTQPSPVSTPIPSPTSPSTAIESSTTIPKLTTIQTQISNPTAKPTTPSVSTLIATSTPSPISTSGTPPVPVTNASLSSSPISTGTQIPNPTEKPTTPSVSTLIATSTPSTISTSGTPPVPAPNASLSSVPISTGTPTPLTSNSGITTVPVTSPSSTAVPTQISVPDTTPRPNATSISTPSVITSLPKLSSSSVTSPATTSVPVQNLTFMPSPQTLGTRPTGALTLSSDTPSIPSVIPKAPETSSSTSKSFSDALAAFVRSAGPTFIYCRNLLPNCTTKNRTSRASSKAKGSTPQTLSLCKYCITLKNTCSNLESSEPVSPVRNDTYQAFQALIPSPPSWPPVTSPVALTRAINDPTSNSTAKPRPSDRFAESIDFRDVVDEAPSGLSDVAQYAETHFNYCRGIRSFCPRLESTRPYWEGSSEVPRKWKESFLSTINACSYCRSLWPLCFELETSEFLLDPAQLFTLRALEEDVSDAIFTLNYCRNMTEDCSKLNATQYLQEFTPQARSVPVADPVQTQISFLEEQSVSELVEDLSEPLQSEDGNEEDSGGIQLVIYCRRVSSICSQLTSM